MTDPATPRGARSAHILLSVRTKRSGAICGESKVAEHGDDIDVKSWRWGVAAVSAVGTTQATSRRQHRQLVVVKDVDSASTALLTSLTTNDAVTELVLTMRKASGDFLPYYKMTLKGGRVTDVDFQVDDSGAVTEAVSFSYTTIDIEYRRLTSGALGGTYAFNDELLPPSA